MDERRAETRRKQRKQQRYRRLTYLTVLALLLAGCGVWFAARAGWGPVPPPDSSGDTSQGGASSEDGTGSQGAASSGSSPADSSQDSNPPEEKTDQPAWFVPESQAVDAGWYDDAVFLGDSRLDGFRLYAGPSGATYFTEAGAKALSIQEKNTERLADGSKVPMLKALEGKTFSKVYLNLGMNNLGDYDLQKEFVEAYADDIDRIRAIQPDCDIYLMTLFPVTAEQEAKGSYVNNHRRSQQLHPVSGRPEGHLPSGGGRSSEGRERKPPVGGQLRRHPPDAGRLQALAGLSGHPHHGKISGRKRAIP